MVKQKPKLTIYETMDGAYGMYLVADGFRADVDFGSFFYSKEQVDSVLAAKDAEIAQLRSDIADLRDDKKTTDAILDERNAEITELQDRLRASEKQNGDLINSASQIMILQDKALANSANTQGASKCMSREQLVQLAENVIRALADPIAYSTFELAWVAGDTPMAVVTGASHG